MILPPDEGVRCHVCACAARGWLLVSSILPDWVLVSSAFLDLVSLTRLEKKKLCLLLWYLCPAYSSLIIPFYPHTHAFLTYFLSFFLLSRICQVESSEVILRRILWAFFVFGIHTSQSSMHFVLGMLPLFRIFKVGDSQMDPGLMVGHAFIIFDSCLLLETPLLPNYPTIPSTS